MNAQLNNPSISHNTGTARQNICDALYFLKEIAKQDGIGAACLPDSPEFTVNACLALIDTALKSINESVMDYKACKYGNGWAVLDVQSRAYVLFGRRKEMTLRANELNAAAKGQRLIHQ